MAGAPSTAQHLLDLHARRAVFDFCGGMLFELHLTEALRAHLATTPTPPAVYDASVTRMHRLPGYSPSAAADNTRIFHGREVRKVPHAAGGHGFVLQLSLADGGDAEGWTPQEVGEYSGWQHDSQRTWRDAARLEAEGCAGVRERFGPAAFALHHRFYFHAGAGGELWLAAEDGCEGRLVQ